MGDVMAGSDAAKHIEILLEEPSAEAALRNLVPKIIGPAVSFHCVVFQGKSDMLAHLENRLRGYRAWIPPSWRVLVLLDRDDDDCRELKRRLERTAESVGFTTKTALPARGDATFQVVNRIAVEELESWFFGDVQALTAAYPGVPPTLAEKSRYRDPDAIRNTWESLESVLKAAGHHLGGLEKRRAAREISLRMTPDANRSRSFQVFRAGLLSLCQ